MCYTAPFIDDYHPKRGGALWPLLTRDQSTPISFITLHSLVSHAVQSEFCDKQSSSGGEQLHWRGVEIGRRCCGCALLESWMIRSLLKSPSFNLPTSYIKRSSLESVGYRCCMCKGNQPSKVYHYRISECDKLSWNVGKTKKLTDQWGIISPRHCCAVTVHIKVSFPFTRSNLPFNLESACSRLMFVAEWKSLLGCV